MPEKPYWLTFGLLVPNLKEIQSLVINVSLECPPYHFKRKLMAPLDVILKIYFPVYYVLLHLEYIHTFFLIVEGYSIFISIPVYGMIVWAF